MNFLLINDNPIVSRLITLSVKKIGNEIDEATSFKELPKENYDVVFVDSELYNQADIDDMKETGLIRHFVYIAKRGENKPKNMDYILEKPFLPTDFIDLGGEIDAKKEENIDTDELKEEIFPSDDLDIPEIENTISFKENEKIQLDMSKFEEEKSTSEAEITDEDDSLDPILNNEDIYEIKQLLEDDNELVLEESDDEEKNKVFFDKDLSEVSDVIENEKEPSVEAEIFPLDNLDDDSSKEKIEDIVNELELDENEDFDLEKLDTKEQIFDETEEEIDQYDDLDIIIKNSDDADSTISSIDDIKEIDLLKALGGEVETFEETTKKIVDELSEKEETTQKSSDIEEEIQNKVSQSVKEALENSFIKEALKGMKVNVSITFEEN